MTNGYVPTMNGLEPEYDPSVYNAPIHPGTLNAFTDSAKQAWAEGILANTYKTFDLGVRGLITETPAISEDERKEMEADAPGLKIHPGTRTAVANAMYKNAKRDEFRNQLSREAYSSHPVAAFTGSAVGSLIDLPSLIAASSGAKLVFKEPLAVLNQSFKGRALAGMAEGAAFESSREVAENMKRISFGEQPMSPLESATNIGMNSVLAGLAHSAFVGLKGRGEVKPISVEADRAAQEAAYSQMEGGKDINVNPILKNSMSLGSVSEAELNDFHEDMTTPRGSFKKMREAPIEPGEEEKPIENIGQAVEKYYPEDHQKILEKDMDTNEKMDKKNINEAEDKKPLYREMLDNLIECLRTA